MNNNNIVIHRNKHRSQSITCNRNTIIYFIKYVSTKYDTVYQLSNIIKLIGNYIIHFGGELRLL